MAPSAALDLPAPSTVLNLLDWAMRGLTPYQDLLENGFAKLIFPADVKGSKFLVLENYAALLAYNPAQTYVLSVCALGDAIVDGSGFVQPWPTGEAALTREKRSVQIALSALGYEHVWCRPAYGPKHRSGALEVSMRPWICVVDAYPSRVLWAELAGQGPGYPSPKGIQTVFDWLASARKLFPSPSFENQSRSCP